MGYINIKVELSLKHLRDQYLKRECKDSLFVEAGGRKKIVIIIIAY